MEDKIILDAGYHQAIRDMLEILKDFKNYDLIENKIMKRKLQRELGENNYEGYLYKYYDKENNLGYIVFDDIYETKGVCIFVEDNTFVELQEQDVLFAKKKYPCIWNKKYKDKDLIKVEYQSLYNKFKKQDS